MTEQALRQALWRETDTGRHVIAALYVLLCEKEERSRGRDALHLDQLEKALAEFRALIALPSFQCISLQQRDAVLEAVLRELGWGPLMDEMPLTREALQNADRYQ